MQYNKIAFRARSVSAATLLSLVGFSASASPVTLTFAGIVNSSQDPRALLGDAFHIGQSFSAVVTFDPELGIDTTNGRNPADHYSLSYFGADSHIIVKSNGVMVSTAPVALSPCTDSVFFCAGGNFITKADSNSAGGDSLRYIQRGPVTVGNAVTKVEGDLYSSIYVILSDYSRTAFSGGVSPYQAPDLTKFLSWTNFQISASGKPGSLGTPEVLLSVSGRIDSVTMVVSSVPEPSTYALMLAGVFAVGTVVRRRSHQ